MPNLSQLPVEQQIQREIATQLAQINVTLQRITGSLERLASASGLGQQSR